MVCTSTISCSNEEYRRRKRRRKKNATREIYNHTTNATAVSEEERIREKRRKKNEQRERETRLVTLHFLVQSECTTTKHHHHHPTQSYSFSSVTFLQIDVNYQLNFFPCHRIVHLHGMHPVQLNEH